MPCDAARQCVAGEICGDDVDGVFVLWFEEFAIPDIPRGGYGKQAVRLKGIVLLVFFAVFHAIIAQEDRIWGLGKFVRLMSSPSCEVEIEVGHCP